MDIAYVNIIVSIIGAVGGIVAAFIGWFFVRPADKKLSAVESALQRNNESMAGMRNALLGSSVRLTELRYNKLVESCEAVYDSFMKVYGASAGLLLICSSLKDLDEIRKTLKEQNKLERMRKWLNLFVKDEMLIPVKLANISAAEIFAPDHVWGLYCAAQSLYSSAMLQMAALKNGLDFQVVKRDDLNAEIDKVIPGQKKFLEKFGTFGYRSSMNLIKTTLLNEIRLTVKSGSIVASDIVAINRQLERAVEMPPFPEELRDMIAPEVALES